MRTRTPISAEQIVAALDASNGDVEQAATSLGVSGRTLYRRMAEYGIKKPAFPYQVVKAAA